MPTRQKSILSEEEKATASLPLLSPSGCWAPQRLSLPCQLSVCLCPQLGLCSKERSRHLTGLGSFYFSCQSVAIFSKEAGEIILLCGFRIIIMTNVSELAQGP